MKRRVISILVSACLGAALNPVLATENASIEQDVKKNSTADTLQDVYVISNKHVNRIVTPFEEPSIVIDDIPDTSHETKGSVIYLATKVSGIDISGFISEKGDENSAVRVIFKPMPLPPQEVVLKGQRSFGSKIAREFEQSNPRNSTITQVMATLASGNLPEGYSLNSPMLKYIPKCQQDGLVFNFFNGQLASGGDYVVSIGTVHNITDHVIPYNVSNCFDTEGVVANSSYPHELLKPNQKSEAFVMFYREKPTVNQEPKRYSLLGE